jgi:hypothetical protein
VHRALGVQRVARVVGDHAHRRAAAVQLAQQLHHAPAVARVQVPRGLVGEDDGRVAHHRARHRHALLLAARELRRVVPLPVAHPHPLQRRRHAPTPLGAGERVLARAVRERQLHVLVHREVADQVERLEDEPDLRLRTCARCAASSAVTSCPASV